jgi:hypothetical protein
MQQQRTSSSSILNSLRRNYSARGLPTRTLPSTLPDNRPHVAVNAEINSMDRKSPSSSLGSLNGNVVFGIKNARRTVALLKFSPSPCRDDDDTDDETVMSDSDSECDVFASSGQHPDRTYSIRFDSYVKVVEIPNRLSYTSMQRQLMWSGNKAIRENARRNRVEYEWEGSHWHNVVEEEEFLLVDGEKVHPVHALR